jgi:hypothetical protein
MRAATAAGRRRVTGGTGIGSGIVLTSFRWAVTGRGAGGDAGYSATGRGHTFAVDTFTLFVALRPDRPLDGAAVDALGAVLRPDDEDLRIWPEAGRGLLRVSTECAAEDLDAALELGHALGAEASAACPGSLLEVSALGDEDSLVWRSVP